VAEGGVGVRVVLGYGLLAGPTCRGSLLAGRGEVAGTTREALTGWAVHMRWLRSRAHTVAHADVEFELEADPSSKSAC
jgi:hypothetical protein